MSQRSEFKMIQGTETEINRALAIETPQGWKPILMSSVLVGMAITAQILLERAVIPEN